MNLSIKIQTACIILATFVSAISCFSNDLHMKGNFVLVIGFFWLYGQKRGWNLTASLGLIVFFYIAVSAIVLKIPAEWMLLSVIAVICAWDLDWFVHRIKKIAHIKKMREIEQQHLKRLLIIAVTSLILGVITLNLKFRFNLGLMLLLALIAALCLGRLFKFLLAEND